MDRRKLLEIVDEICEEGLFEDIDKNWIEDFLNNTYSNFDYNDEIVEIILDNVNNRLEESRKEACQNERISFINNVSTYIEEYITHLNNIEIGKALITIANNYLNNYEN